jgi:hypothetical protein
MKKTIFGLIFAFYLVFGVFCQAANSSGPIDLVVVLDTSSSMSGSYRETSDYLIGPFLREFLRIGDTFHLISFSGTPKLEISRLIEGSGDVETIIARLLLMYPLDPESDVSGALRYAENFASSLPSRSKKIVLVSDGSAPGTQNLVSESSVRFRGLGADLQYIKVPVTGDAPRSGRSVPAQATTPAQTAQSAPPQGAQSAQTAPQAAPTSQSQAGQTAQSTQTAQQGAATSQTTQTNQPTQSAQTTQTAQNTQTTQTAQAAQPTQTAQTTETRPSEPTQQTQSTSTGESRQASGQTATQESGASGSAQVQPSGQGSGEGTTPVGPATVTDRTQTQSQSSKGSSEIRGIAYGGNVPLPLIIGLGLLLLLLLIGIIIFASRRLDKSPNRVLAKAAAPGSSGTRAEQITPIRKTDHVLEYPPPKMKPLPKDKIYDENSNNGGPLLLNLFVADQNTAIGKRNIHSLKPGYSLTIGGGKSDFLIFLVQVPPQLAEVRYDGRNCTLVPRKPQYFPDIGSQTISNCIGKTFRVISDKKYELHIRLERYEDPLMALNKLLRSIKVPGPAV